MRMILGSLGAGLCLVAAGCQRGAQGGEQRAPATGLTEQAATRQIAGVEPGISPQVVLGSVENPYAGNVAAAATGRQLFVGFNCAGCHSGYAGGGMGPNLRDSLWIYGSKDAQIFSTIAEGRPYGMPAWGGRLPDGQIWKLVTYIKTLGTSAEPDKPPKPSESKVRSAPQPKKRPG
jgi:cytochrome c oxidase cbb3-type subunit III